MKIKTLLAWAKRLKRDAVTLWFAYRLPETPKLAKALCVFVVAYALSPIDLIPDFIPVLGYLDEALLLPALIWAALRMMPHQVIAVSRAKADDWMHKQKKPISYLGAALVIAVWVIAAILLVLWLR